MDHKRRLQNLRESFSSRKLDAMLVSHSPNVRYLCGFTGSAGALVVDENGAAFFTDGRYGDQARNQVQGARIRIARKSPLLAAAEWLADQAKRHGGKHLRRLGYEADNLSVAERDRLAAALPSWFRLKPTSGTVEALRMIKDNDELSLIRAAVKLGASLFESALQTIRAGVKEMEVAAQMEFCARRKGAEAMSFETIIASGPRSAQPHGRASDHAIPGGGFVVCDFGVILTGYCSDQTRTLFVGQPSAEMRRGYEAVREAQQAALNAAGPGVAVGEVDAAARKLLRQNGLAKYFTHSTGHGVGLEIHEAPRVATGQTEVLRPGMVITIEPGIYVPGQWGVRIEDMIVINDRGCEVLTPTTKELLTI